MEHVCELPPNLSTERAAERASLLQSTRARFMPCTWQTLATVRPMPDAEPGMRAGDEGCVACFEDGVEWYDWWAGMLIGREVERCAEG